jgi:hypothetical protein
LVREAQIVAAGTASHYRDTSLQQRRDAPCRRDLRFRNSFGLANFDFIK